MSERADCVIIGGGVIGASIAYHLTRLGCHDVVLLEKDYLASKATGVCPRVSAPSGRTRPRASTRGSR